MKYVILDVSELNSVDFSEVKEKSTDYLSLSVDGTKTFVKFEGDTPSSLEGKTEYTYAEILKVLATDEWTPSDPE
jgi:hypothetical protein